MYINKKYSPFRYYLYNGLASEYDDCLETFGEITLNAMLSIIEQLEIDQTRDYLATLFNKVWPEVMGYLRDNKKRFDNEKANGELENLCLGRQQGLAFTDFMRIGNPLSDEGKPLGDGRSYFLQIASKKR